MFKMILIWFLLSIGIALGVTQVRHMTGKELWSNTKTMAFGAACSAGAIFILILIVVLF